MENTWQFLEHAANIMLYTIYNSISEHVLNVLKRCGIHVTFCKNVPIFKVFNQARFVWFGNKITFMLSLMYSMSLR